MQTINLQVKGKPLVFTNKSVTYAGHEFFYGKMSNISHRGGNQPAFIFDYEGKRLALPYDPKHKDITMKIFRQIAALELKRKARAAHPAPPKEKPAVSSRRDIAYTLSFSPDTPVADYTPAPRRPVPDVYEKEGRERGFWSIGRLVIGIISVLLFLLIAFQSCAAGLIDALEAKDALSGLTGLFTAIAFLISGVLAVCTRNSRSIIGPIFISIVYFAGAVLGFATGVTYGGLPIWSGLSAIFGVVFVICAVKTKKIYH